MGRETHPRERLLDRWLRPTFVIRGRALPAFRACGLVGFSLATAAVLGLAARQGLSVAIVPLLAGASAATFLGLAVATKYLVRAERYVYYHHEIMVVAVVALCLRALRVPPLPYLDLTVVGLGIFLACGRCGCFLAGCCHGKPGRWGARYGPRHEAIPRHLAGARLVPLQLVESAVVLGIVVVAVALIARGAPGEALAWYAIAYGCWRFGAEFLRGDMNRPYAGGFSEAQWTSLVLMSAVCLSELRGTLPLHVRDLAATTMVAATMIAMALFSGEARRLFLPPHVRQLSAIVAQSASGSFPRDGVVRTSLGLRVSAAALAGEAGEITIFSLSRRGPALSDRTTARLGRLIAQLRYGAGAVPPEIRRGNDGVHHVIVRAPGGVLELAADPGSSLRRAHAV